MTVSNARLLGLFPSYEAIGGIETSGRLAWEPFAADAGAHILLSYGAKGARNPARINGRGIHTSSKGQAILAALLRKWPANFVLVWHLGLLKLLPFMRLGDAKVALFLHGIEAWRTQDRLTQRMLRRVSLFLSNSEYTWRRFASYNPGFEQAAHRIVNLGVGSAWGQPTPPPADPPAVLMLGRIMTGEQYKGHREMLAAWPLVLARHPGAQLWIAGPGPLGAHLEREVRARGLETSVRVLGTISEQEKQDLLMRCRCLALPSRAEGFGLVYLEAMRVGRPCLVSTLDAGREVVNPPEAGLAADLDNQEELAAATCRLLSAGAEWDRWSAHARNRYETSFTAEMFQGRLLAALAELGVR